MVNATARGRRAVRALTGELGRRARRSMTGALVALLVVAGSGLIWGVLVGGAGIAHADSVDARLNAAMAWLTAQPTDGLALEQRADFALALEVGGAPAGQVATAVDQLWFVAAARGPGQLTVPELAKTILAVSVAGQDPTSVAGVDLVGELRGRIGVRPAAPGQFLTDYGSELAGQSWAILALARVGQLPAGVVDFLRTRQCGDGSFDRDPVSGCRGQESTTDQALVLAALVAAQRTQPQQGAAIARLLGWVGTELNQPSGTRITASGLAYLVAPLQAWNAGQQAGVARAQVLALQILDNPYPGVTGAIGAETPVLLQDLLAKRLVPASGPTIAAMLAFNPVDLTQYRYAERTGWTGLAPSRPQLVTSDQAVVLGGHLTALATGFPPGTVVTVRLTGYRAALASATTDANGRARFSLTATADTAQRYTLDAEGGGALAQTTLTITDPQPPNADGTSGSGGQHSDQIRWPVMSTPATLVAGLGLVSLLGCAAVLLRRTVRR